MYFFVGWKAFALKSGSPKRAASSVDSGGRGAAVPDRDRLLQRPGQRRRVGSGGRTSPAQVTRSSCQSRRSSSYFSRLQPPLVVQLVAEQPVLHGVVALADDDVDPAAGEVVDRREVLGDAHRVQQRQHGHGADQPHPGGQRRDVAEHHRGRGRDERRGVPLADPHGVEADLLGPHGAVGRPRRCVPADRSPGRWQGRAG